MNGKLLYTQIRSARPIGREDVFKALPVPDQISVCVYCCCFASFLILRMCRLDIWLCINIRALLYITNSHCCNKSADFTIKSFFLLCYFFLLSHHAEIRHSKSAVCDIVEISFEGDTRESFFSDEKYENEEDEVCNSFTKHNCKNNDCFQITFQAFPLTAIGQTQR